VVKRYAKRRVVSVVHRVVRGTAEVSKPQAIAEVLRKTRTGTVINTAYIERLNATFRSALAPLARRGACHRAFGEHADRRDVLGRLCL
jgi:hypothetical protein